MESRARGSSAGGDHPAAARPDDPESHRAGRELPGDEADADDGRGPAEGSRDRGSRRRSR